MSQGGVLIVDDDRDLLQALPQALRLQMSGVIVETADSAAGALDRIPARGHDPVVTDSKMAGMAALGLLAKVRTGRRPNRGYRPESATGAPPAPAADPGLHPR